MKYCPICENESPIEEINTIESFEVRGESISVQREYNRCLTCGEEFETLHPDKDFLEIAYREYRHHKGWPQPEEIKTFRESVGLTQQQFSDLLGIGIATLNRYENGALQSEANNQLISLCIDDPWILLKFAESKQTILSDQDRQELIARIERVKNGVPKLVSDAIDRYGSYKPSILSGDKPFDFKIFCEVAKILCHQSGQFTTKLQKLFFYVDFKHYKEYRQSITGMQYAKLPHGPTPDEYKTWLAALTDWTNTLKAEVVIYDKYCGEVFTSTSDPDFNIFSLEELNTIRFVKGYFENFSSGDIEEFSHKEKGYQETGHSKVIPYEFADNLQI